MIGNTIAGFLGTGVAVSASSYESIATTTVGAGGASTITFTSIPSTYTHLQIRCLSKDSRSAQVNSTLDYRFNSDSAANYSYHELQAFDPTVNAYATASASTLRTYGAGASGTNFGVTIIDILDYANTNKYKTTRQLYGIDTNGANSLIGINSGSWRSTSAITSITITPLTSPIVQYSSFALYGIKG
jgi:hypothetical protein